MSPREAKYLSTPMVKGELLALLPEIRPQRTWPKRPHLKDLIDYAVHELSDTDDDPRVVRARELAQVIYRNERR